jgi:hypothetical protein
MCSSNPLGEDIAPADQHQPRTSRGNHSVRVAEVDTLGSDDLAYRRRKRKHHHRQQSDEGRAAELR